MVSSESLVRAPRILLAEDDPVTRTLLSSFFDRLGWGCAAVESGDAVLSAIASEKFEIVVTDLEMPGVAGLNLLRDIRQLSPTQAVVVITGQQQSARITEIIQAGAIDLLEKPLDLELVRTSVERIIGVLRQDRLRSSLYKHVALETTEFIFTTAELHVRRFELPIIERLYDAGILTVNERLTLELSFQEALANAIEHGNLELASVWREDFDRSGLDKFSREKAARLVDPSYSQRQVRIKTTLENDLLTLAVSDQGPGFQSNGSAQSSQSVSAAPMLHGRGLSIMRASVDECVITDGGRTTILKKKLNRSKK